MTTENTITKEAQQQEVAQAERIRSGRVYRPRVNIVESVHELTITADMPGANPDNIDVDFNKGKLTIHARVEDRSPKEGQYLVNEFGVGDFHREFEVSESIDSTKLTAEYRDGVLVLHLPKVEAAKPRKIAVVGG